MFVTVRAKSILAAVLVFALAVICCIGLNFEAVADVYNNESTRKLPVYGVDCGEEKKVALTFDAAWGADKTQGILDTLNEYGATGTFFLVGFWVDDYPEMVKTIDEAGCEIGTHSNTHPDMAKLSANEVKEELSTSIEKIEAVTGKEVTLFRAPFGSYNNTLLDSAEELGLKTIQWDVDTLDWKGLSGSEMNNRVLSKVKNGSIILMHNNSDNIIEGLRLILLSLQNMGYKIGSVSDLVIADNYTIDRNGVQHAN